LISKRFLAKITLAEFTDLNHLIYEATNSGIRVAVFSEMYYEKGLEIAYIDGVFKTTF